MLAGQAIEKRGLFCGLNFGCKDEQYQQRAHFLSVISSLEIMRSIA